MAVTTSEKVVRVRLEPVGSGTQAFNNQLRSILAAGGATNAQMSRLSTNFGAVGAASNRAAGGIGAANNNTSLLNAAFGTLNGTTGATAQTLGRLNGTLGSLALAGASAGVLGLAGALTFATTQANGYADKLAEISTLIDTTKFSMSNLSDGLKEQAALFGASPIDQAGAAYDIISSGASTAADAIATLNSANTLAAVGATNVGVAANGLTSVINAFAQQGLTATDAADSLFVTVRDGKISMEQLSSSIGNVAPIAATLGLSLDDVGASIAALTLGGVGGAEAVTNIRAALTAVIKPSQEASKLAEKLGLDFSSAALKAKGWPAFLQDIKEKTKGSQDALAILMGGTEALSGVLALTTTASGSFNNSLANMKNKAGDAAAGLKKIQDASPTFQFNRVMAAMQVTAVNLGESISTALVPALKYLADNFDTVVTIVLTAMIPVMARLAVVYGTTMVQAVVTFTATAAMRFASLAAAQGVLTASTMTMSAGFSSLVGLFGGPWGLALAGAAAGIYALTSNTMAAHNTVAQYASKSHEAAVETEQTGVQALLAARGVASFGGQAGEAAGKLWQMATAARAAATESAKLALQKANAKVDEIAGQTTGGLRNRWAMTRDMPMDTVGDIARRMGARAQIGWDYVWKPSDREGNAALKVALRERQAASDNLRSIRGKREEDYLPSTPPPGGGLDIKGLMATPKKGPKEKVDHTGEKIADFWKSFESDLANAKVFGIELQKQTKEIELQKIAKRNLTSLEKTNIANAVQDIASAKAITSMKQRTAELASEYSVELGRQTGLTESQKAIEDEIFARRIANKNAGVSIATTEYQLNEAALRKQLEANAALRDKNALLAKAADFAKSYSPVVQLGFDIKAIEDGRKAFMEAFSAGTLKDALGKPLTQATADAINAGADQAIRDLKNKPLELVAKVSPMMAQRLDVDRVTAEHKAREAAILDPANNMSKVEREQAIKDEARFFRDEYQRANTIVSNHFADEMISAVDGVADIFDLFSKSLGGAIRGLGDAIDKIKDLSNPDNSTNKLMNMISGKLGAGFSQATKGMTDFKGGLDNIGNPMKGLKEAFSGPQGSAIKGIGAAVGGAMAGAEMGSKIGEMMSAIGIKNGEKGAKIGGAIGGITGNPVIAAATSAIGGLIGSVLYKPKYGTASVTGGDASDISIKGNKSAKKEAASGAAGSVQAGLNDLAAKLGGAVGDFKVSIGQYKDEWRVSTTGYGGKLGGKGKMTEPLGIKGFGDDMAAAVQFAITDAIKDGAITGVSGWVSTALKDAGADAATALFSTFRAMTDDLDAILDPVGASVRSVTTPIDQLIESMKKYGATAADTAKLEQYKTLKVQEALKSQLSSINDFMDALKGEGSGITQMTRLTDKLGKFDTMKANISAGKTVDQDDYVKLGQDIFSLAREVYGTSTSQFQDIRSLLVDTSTALGANVTTAVNSAAGYQVAPVSSIDGTSVAIRAQTDAVVSATKQQTDDLVEAISLGNDYIRQLVESTRAATGGYSSQGGGGGQDTVNGRYVQRAV